MTARPIRLHSVKPSAETRLRNLFAREDELLDELAKVIAQQREARRDYSAQHGLLLHPSLESLRKVLSA